MPRPEYLVTFRLSDWGIGVPEVELLHRIGNTSTGDAASTAYSIFTQSRPGQFLMLRSAAFISRLCGGRRRQREEIVARFIHQVVGVVLGDADIVGGFG